MTIVRLVSALLAIARMLMERQARKEAERVGEMRVRLHMLETFEEEFNDVKAIDNVLAGRGDSEWLARMRNKYNWQNSSKNG